MDPIMSYLKDNKLPHDKKEALRVTRKAARYWISPDGELFRRSFKGPYLLCVHPKRVEGVIQEVHSGSCGGHAGGRSLAHRLLSQGYWWPTMRQDCLALVKKCDSCQRFSPLIHQPVRNLQPLTSPWPFAQWGVDIVGKLPTAVGGHKFLITATDYFTKWVEAEPLVTITKADVTRFCWRNLVSRFGVPYAIISDNGSQFISDQFIDFCKAYHINYHNSAVYYPQCNGQAEASNKTIQDGIKKRLTRARGKWAEELPHVLWAYRTTPRISTGQSPFALAFGMEAVIPLEVDLPTLRTKVFDPKANEEAMASDLDLLEEKRESARIRLAAYQQQVAKAYNRTVRIRTFKVGDLVLKKAVGGKKPGKLEAKMEGPYRVTKIVSESTYKLANMDGEPLPRPWNATNLRIYYH